jgi:hypothetical protein
VAEHCLTHVKPWIPFPALKRERERERENRNGDRNFAVLNGKT